MHSFIFNSPLVKCNDSGSGPVLNDVCNNPLLECRSTTLSDGSESIDLLELRHNIHWVDLEQQFSWKPFQSASCSGLVALDDIEHSRLSVEMDAETQQ